MTKTRSTDLMVYGKMPPQAPELECSILGMMMIDANSIDKVLVLLDSDDFYLSANQLIYNSIQRVFLSGAQPNFIRVVSDLKKAGELEDAGGSYYVSQLTEKIYYADGIEIDCLKVKQFAMLRNIISLCGNAITEAYGVNVDVFTLESKLQLGLSSLTGKIKTSKISKVGDVAVQTYKEMCERAAVGGDLVGLSTGFANYDRITGGLISPDLTILAAGPGEGKSTFSLNVAENVANNHEDVGVAFFSLEMSKQQLMWKMFSAQSGLSVKKIRKGELSEDQHIQFTALIERYQKTNLYIHDEGGLSVYDFRSICRTLKSKHNIGFIVVDYLQLMTVHGGVKNFGMREQEVSEISRELKACAKELQIPIWALSQVSRPEPGTKKLYGLSKLRESGAIEQNADNVVFLFRPSYHKISSMDLGDGERQFSDDDVVIQLEKFRLGDTGITMAKFLGAESKFIDPNAPIQQQPTQPEKSIIERGSKAIPNILPQNQEEVPF